MSAFLDLPHGTVALRSTPAGTELLLRTVSTRRVRGEDGKFRWESQEVWAGSTPAAVHAQTMDAETLINALLEYTAETGAVIERRYPDGRTDLVDVCVAGDSVRGTRAEQFTYDADRQRAMESVILDADTGTAFVLHGGDHYWAAGFRIDTGWVASTGHRARPVEADDRSFTVVLEPGNHERVREHMVDVARRFSD